MRRGASCALIGALLLLPLASFDARAVLECEGAENVGCYREHYDNAACVDGGRGEGDTRVYAGAYAGGKRWCSVRDGQRTDTNAVYADTYAVFVVWADSSGPYERWTAIVVDVGPLPVEGPYIRWMDSDRDGCHVYVRPHVTGLEPTTLGCPAGLAPPRAPHFPWGAMLP